MKKIIITLICGAVFVCGCATAPKMNRLSIGMTKKEVIHVMGSPASTASPGGGMEVLRYELTTTAAHAEYHITDEFYVRLINGKVDSYGRMGDFNSTQNPTYNYNINEKIRTAP